MTTIVAAAPENATRLTHIAMTAKQHWGYSDSFMLACAAELKVTQEKIASDRFSYWIAYHHQAIAGFAYVCWDSELSTEDTACELEALFVLPEYMGMSIGKRLYRHVLQQVKVANRATLLIQSDPNAQPFYEKIGANVVSMHPSDSIPGRLLPLMSHIVT